MIGDQIEAIRELSGRSRKDDEAYIGSNGFPKRLHVRGTRAPLRRRRLFM